MAGKGKKKRNSKDSTGSGGSGGDKKKGGGDKKKGGGKSKKKGGSGKSTKFQGDIFNEGAIENAYLICHNVQDVLKVRGFPWPEAKKKKGKKK